MAEMFSHFSYIKCFFIPLYVTEPALRRGESVYLVGLSRSLQATSRKSVVTNPCAALNISSADSPRYRATNMEVIELDTGTLSLSTIKIGLKYIDLDCQVVIFMLLYADFGSSFSGVLTDEHGRVKAIWGSFSTQVCTKNRSKKKKKRKVGFLRSFISQ